jgi:hypothetical protein
MKIYVGSSNELSKTDELIKFADEHNSLIITSDKSSAAVVFARSVVLDKDVLVCPINDYIENTRRIKDKPFDSIVVDNAIAALSAALLKSTPSNKNEIDKIDAISIGFDAIHGYIDEYDVIPKDE